MNKPTQLEQSLADLRTRLLVMCAATGRAVSGACASLAGGSPDKAEDVIAGDAALDELENEIDEAALTLLVRHQPVAQDLRFVASALRMVSDLERIGDESVTIAEHSLNLPHTLPPSIRIALEELSASAREQYARAMEAFREADAVMALALRRLEDERIDLEERTIRTILDNMRCSGEEREARAVMHAILIAHSLNRISRRAANIAEHTVFIVQGRNIKHGPLE